MDRSAIDCALTVAHAPTMSALHPLGDRVPVHLGGSERQTEAMAVFSVQVLDYRQRLLHASTTVN